MDKNISKRKNFIQIIKILIVILIQIGVLFMPVKMVIFSRPTFEMLNTEIEQAIKENSKKYQIDEALIKAIIKVESERFPFAFRYEPHLKNAKWYRKLLTKQEQTNWWCYCSYGVMQILYGIAKSEGFKGKPEELQKPGNSIEYGVRYLKTLIKRYYYLEDVVSAYNQGTNAKDEKGRFKNQKYVNKVLKYYRKYKKEVI